MFWRIALLAKPFWKALGVVALLIVVMSGLKQVEPMVAREITDTLIGDRVTQARFSLFQLLGLLLVARLAITGLNRLTWYLTSIYSEKLRAHLREVGFEHLLGLSLSFFHKSISGKMMSQLDRGVNRISQVVNNSGMHFVPNVITAIISMVIVMRYSAVLGVAAVASFVPFTVISLWRVLKKKKVGRKKKKIYDF